MARRGYTERFMSRLDYRTAGESHGQALIVYVEGLPAGVVLDTDRIDAELRRRQGGYGRGGRMKIETDTINILSGIRNGISIGSPIAAQIANKDWRIHCCAAWWKKPAWTTCRNGPAETMSGIRPIGVG